MRWLYYDKNNTSEAVNHDRVVRQIHDWWQKFTDKADDIDALFRQSADWDLAEWMQQQLQSIHPELMWEFGPAINTKGHRLVITPEINAELRPLAEAIVNQAPSLRNWEFYTYRLPEDLETTLQTVEVRCDLDVKDVTVNVSAGEGNRIDLIFRWGQLAGDDEQTFNAAFVTAETLLGEEMLDRWVGTIQLVDRSTPEDHGQRFIPLERLKPTFDSVVQSLRSQLPAEPLAAAIDDARWAVLKLEPQEASDYPDRYDLMTCVTCNPDLVSATFSSAPFFSERYSRCGETFCFVKIDGNGDLSGMEFEDREDLEEAVRNALEIEDAGTLAGGGTGLRYTYLELALTNLETGIAAIRRALQEGNVPRRSWIQFHDANLAGEWIGIYDDSPEPPQAPAEV